MPPAAGRGNYKPKTNNTMNAKTLEAIKRHGESLLRAFPEATERDPVALCKKLRRIETVAHRMAELACEREVPEQDEADAKAIQRVRTLLGITEHQAALILFVNRDPRGYALKIRESFANGINLRARAEGKHEFTLFTDWGGDGIIAPDLTAN